MLGRDARAAKAAAHAAAAAMLLPGGVAEVLGKQAAHLHAEHARLRARKGRCCTPEGGRGERGEREGGRRRGILSSLR